MTVGQDTTKQMSEWIDSHQHYTVPFTLIHTEDKLITQTIQKLNSMQKKQTMQNTAKQN